MVEELAEEAAAGAAVTLAAGRAAWEVWEAGTVVAAVVRVAAGTEAGKAGLVGEEGRG